jgi:hypothetical protein
MSFFITPRRLLLFLGACIAALLLMHVFMIVEDDIVTHSGKVSFLREMFDLNREKNVPTMFSTLQLFLASGLLLTLFTESRQSTRGDAFYWLGLSMVFGFLAFDEFCELHERLMAPTRRLLHTHGALQFAWVIPYAALVAAFAGLYLRFWWRLPSRSRWLFAAAGATYVGSGIGMEVLGSYVFTLYGWNSIQFDVQTLFEEVLEMSGVALFVFALTELVRDRARSFLVRLAPAPSTGPRELVSDAIEGDTIRLRKLG